MVVRAIQLDWIFLQCITSNTGYVFAGIEKLLQEKNPVPFLQKIEIYHTPHRNSKYTSGQEGRPGPPKSRDIRKRKNPMFAACNNGADYIHDDSKLIFH